MRTLFFAVYILMPVLACAQNTIVADIAAEKLAIQAATGDTNALQNLTTQAAAGSPSAQFGLGYYYNQMMKPLCPCVMQSSLTDALFLKYGAPVLPRCSLDDSRCEQIEKLKNLEISYFQEAYKNADVAAEFSLGELYQVGAISELSFAEVAGGPQGLKSSSDPGDRATFQALTEACSTAISMLHDSGNKGWPRSFFQLSSMYPDATNNSDTFATGCMIADPGKQIALITQAANLGEPVALAIIILQDIKNGDDSDAKILSAKLQALAASDYPEASYYWSYVRSNNAGGN